MQRATLDTCSTSGWCGLIGAVGILTNSQILPDWTTRTLTAFNGWLRAHGKILAAIVPAAGVVLTVNGVTGLPQ